MYKQKYMGRGYLQVIATEEPSNLGLKWPLHTENAVKQKQFKVKCSVLIVVCWVLTVRK